MSAPAYKPYAAYRDSGVKWLGDIPAHWEVRRLKELATIQLSNVDKKSLEGEEPVELCNYTDVYYHDRITSDMDFMQATAPREQVRRFALRAGDVLITKDSESWTDIAVPAVVEEDLPNVLCGYHLAHIRPASPMYGPYLSRAIGAVGPRDQFRVSANGVTRFAIGAEAIATSVFAIPSVAEQRAIATFLDRETARIDALVAKKERLITLLQERRTALITRAVTKGLDPVAPMKDSGVEWLGQIPAHWEVAPVYARYQVHLGKMLDSAKQTNLHSVPYVRNVDVQWDFINTDDLPEMDIPPSERERYRLRGGDILVCEGGEVGRSAIWNQEHKECYYQKAIHRVRPTNPQETPRYFFWLMVMIAQSGVFSGSANQNTIDHLTATQLRHYRFPFAPSKEQRSIAGFLDRETERIDVLIERINSAITRLHELRTALISAAVTGKIDVREAAQ